VNASVDLDDDAFAALVTRLKEHVLAGDVFQIVASRSFSAPCADVAGAYSRLARQNPSPHQFLWNDSAATVFGASPEAAVRVTRESDGALRLHLYPIAGTRGRGQSADEDDRLEAELRLSEKEVAEHMMLVDLARNDVARVSIAGTRRVTRLLATERYSHVMHLCSEVAGTLRPGLDALHAYAACANMGTLVGAPKVRAAELLREHEAEKRGVYGGAIGWLSHDGSFDSAIVIRSAFVKDGVAHVRAGAGIVFDSDPVSEAEETTRKAGAVLRALGVMESA
jgi:anthranilate synthase component 1